MKPSNPFFWDMAGGIGAWEIAARYSYVDLNDNLVFGGEQENVTVGLNWYLNNNMRLMFNWIHGTVEKPTSPDWISAPSTTPSRCAPSSHSEASPLHRTVRDSIF